MSSSSSSSYQPSFRESRHRVSTSSPSTEPRITYTPSPARQPYVSHTSSPSPLARRAESRQSLRSDTRAHTPTPRDFYSTASESFTSDDDDDVAQQSTTPRKGEPRRWVPRSVRAERYASEPPPDVAGSSRAHRPEPTTGKVERWMAGDGYAVALERAALPKEFRMVSPGRGVRVLSLMPRRPIRAPIPRSRNTPTFPMPRTAPRRHGMPRSVVPRAFISPIHVPNTRRRCPSDGHPRSTWQAPRFARASVPHPLPPPRPNPRHHPTSSARKAADAARHCSRK